MAAESFSIVKKFQQTGIRKEWEMKTFFTTILVIYVIIWLLRDGEPMNKADDE
jgi:hypothetical protein